jgi:hypothetical protein
VLLDTHAAIYDKYLRYQMIAVVFRGEIAALQHAELLRCALARDFPAAREVLIAHIQECVDDTIARGTDWETPSPSTRAAEGRAKRGRNRDDAPVAPGSRSGRGRPAQDEKLRAARR